MKAIIAFATMVALDFIWARYNIACSDRKPTRAATCAALIAIVGAINTVIYIDDHWMIIPTVLGAFVGTYFAIWFENDSPSDA